MCECVDAVIDGYCKDCASSNGYTLCVDCDEWVVECHSYNGNDYCLDCFNILDIQLCSGCQEHFDTSDIAVDSYCEDCADSNGYTLCVDCEEWVDEDTTHGYNDCDYCESCFNSLDIRFCCGCDEYFDSSEVHECGNNWYCTSCANNKGWYECYDCEDYTDCTYVGNENDYCESCFFDLFFICDGCDDTYELDDRVDCDYGSYCSGCRPGTEDEGDLQPSFRYMNENTCTKVCSDRRYGLELESTDCPGYIELGLDGWGAKYDASVTGKEFYTAIFRGDRGFRSIGRLCAFAKDHNWTADSTCGYHLHLNMRHEKLDSLKAITIAYYHTRRVWEGMVESSRVGNCYCAPLGDHHLVAENVETQANWSTFVIDSNRCDWVNWVAYHHHKSLEIRLHEGTFNADKICNWIRAHITFTDWASAAGFNTVNDIVSSGQDHKDLLTSIWEFAGCADLVEVYGLTAVTV